MSRHDKNLLEETLATIRAAGKRPEDVSYVAWDGAAGSGGSTVGCRWSDFAPVAARINYYSGYGAQFVTPTLTVVGVDGWWLERHEYDGREWWEYKTTPPLPAEYRAPAVDDLLADYRGGATDVVVADELPAAAEIPERPREAGPPLTGVVVRDDPGAAESSPVLTFEEKTAATVASAAEQMVREQAGKVFVPPEDVPAIMGHFRDILGRATGVALDPPVEAVVIQGEAEVRREDGGQALIYSVYPGPLNSLNESLFVRVQSWDAAGEHRVLKALGTKLKVTVEPLRE